jgi:hypothetical protein
MNDQPMPVVPGLDPSTVAFYVGSDMGNGGGICTAPVPSYAEQQALELLLPRLATLRLRAGH